MLGATRPLKNRATGVSPKPLYKPLCRRVITRGWKSTRAPYLRLRRKRRRVLLSTPRTKKSGPVCLSSPNRATESPESCKLLALKIELVSRLAAGAQARSATPSRPSAERGGLDGVRRRLPETSVPMVICAAGLCRRSE
eukprot:scaffold4736_cov42-Phaeocystis_antarctica.AAC.1